MVFQLTVKALVFLLSRQRHLNSIVADATGLFGCSVRGLKSTAKLSRRYGAKMFSGYVLLNPENFYETSILLAPVHYACIRTATRAATYATTPADAPDSACWS